MIIRYRLQASADIVTIYRYLQKESPRGAESVLRAIRASIDFIGEQPLASQRTQRPAIRAKLVPRYPYKIFFRIAGPGIVEIVHVRHTSRRPWI